jgi:hypothetical protein
LLGDYCFSDCSNLCSVGFEPISSLREIRDCPFSGCNLLNSLSLPASVTVLSSWSLY